MTEPQRRPFAQTTLSGFKAVVQQAIQEVPDMRQFYDNNTDVDLEKVIAWVDFSSLNSAIVTDLKPYDFSTENYESVPDDVWGPYKELAGFQQTESGLCYLGCMAGGDWEVPVFFIVYYDGSTLRAYMPTSGNALNAKLSALSREDFESEQAFDDWQPDAYAMREEISQVLVSEERIAVEPIVVPKGVPKQVIVMRTDLNMRKGKMVAQGAHAAMMWCRERLLAINVLADDPKPTYQQVTPLTKEQLEWVNGSYAKICVGIGSEAELFLLLEKAKTLGLTAELVVDNGHTEFGGVKTATCLAIGPHYPDAFVGVTDGYKLL